MTSTSEIFVKAKKPYTVSIGKELLSSPIIPCEFISNKIVVVITDSNVASLYLQKFVLGLQMLSPKKIKTFSFPAGEKSKNFKTLERILEFLAENKLTRKDVLIALGGGVVGDITGFAAGIYLRGIDFIGVPTTVLAAVDSSVGGKTAIDLSAGKNLAGVFHQPKYVMCDINTFSTLPKDVFSAGIAEAIKYGVISDKKLFLDFKNSKKDIIDIDIITRCIQIKAEIVEKDEFENDIRMLLNYGHTIGHTVEKLSGYEISHGYAVSIGMCCALKIAMELEFCTEPFLEELENLLESYNLPTKLPKNYKKEEIYNIILNDKKCSTGKITLVLPKKLGCCKLFEIETQELLKCLNILK